MSAQEVTGSKRSRLLLPVVLLAVFVMPISISGTSVALPSISQDLGSSPTLLQWVINGFNVASAIFMLVWGIASDRIGYKATFVFGVVIMAAANVVSAVAPSLILLDVGRIIAGVGGAAVFAGAAAIMSNAFSGAARGRAFAFFGTTIGLGLALGPTISGALTSAFGWRGVFGAFVVVTIVSLLGAGTLPKIRPERVAGQKAVDFTLLRNKHFLAFALVPVAQAVGYVTLLSYLPVALSAVKDFSPGTAGLFMLPATVPVFVAPVIAGQLIKRVRWIGPLTMINAALIGLVLGDLGMLLLRPDLGTGAIIVPMILLGFGFGFPVGLVDGEALAAVPARSSGTAAGVVNFMRLGSEAVVVGGFAIVMTALIGATLQNDALTRSTAAGIFGHGDAYAAAFHPVVIGLAAVTLILTVLVNVLHRAHGAAVNAQEGGDAETGLAEPPEIRADIVI